MKIAIVFLLCATLAAAKEICTAMRPIVAVHGIIAAQFYGSAKDIPKTVEMPSYCARNFGKTLMWLSPQNFIPGMFVYFGRVWNNQTKQWSSLPGMTYEVPDYPTMKPIEVLAPGSKWGFENTKIFFNFASNFTQRFGYTEGVNLLSPSYDWRDIANMDWQRRAVALIEKAVNDAGGQRAVVIGHSMGGPYGYYLLQNQPKSWLDKYVEVYVAAGPAWMGAPGAVAAIFSGFDDLIPFLGMPFAKVARKIPALYSLLPLPEGLPKGFELLRTPNKSYSVGQLASALRELGLPDPEERIRQALEPFAKWNYRYDGIPQYKVHQVYSNGRKTIGTLSFTKDFSFHPEGDEADWNAPNYNFVDGDGTVPITSLEYPLQRWRDGGANVKTTRFNNVDHVAIAANKEFIEIIRQYACDP